MLIPSPTRPRRLAVACLAGALSLVAAGCAGPTQDDTVVVNVFAASSVRVLNEDWDAAARQLDPSVQLQHNNGGSSALVQQMAEGAPADILITASAKTMDDAVKAGVVKESQLLASNELVMVVPKGNPAGITSAEDLKDADTLALCDPSVPCGAVSEAIIADAGLKVQADSLESQVADVLGKVTSGEADAGWVYSTDARAAGDAVEVIELPNAAAHRNEIRGAVAVDAPQADAARAALNALAADAEAWRDHGFVPAKNLTKNTANR